MGLLGGRGTGQEVDSGMHARALLFLLIGFISFSAGTWAQSFPLAVQQLEVHSLHAHPVLFSFYLSNTGQEAVMVESQAWLSGQGQNMRVQLSPVLVPPGGKIRLEGAFDSRSFSPGILALSAEAFAKGKRVSVLSLPFSFRPIQSPVQGEAILEFDHSLVLWNNAASAQEFYVFSKERQDLFPLERVQVPSKGSVRLPFNPALDSFPEGFTVAAFNGEFASNEWRFGGKGLPSPFSLFSFSSPTAFLGLSNPSLLLLPFFALLAAAMLFLLFFLYRHHARVAGELADLKRQKGKGNAGPPDSPPAPVSPVQPQLDPDHLYQIEEKLKKLR